MRIIKESTIEKIPGLTPLQSGKVFPFFSRNRFDGQDLLDLAKRGNIAKIVINSKATNSVDYSRIHFNRLDADGQEKYMARINKVKTDYEVYISGSRGYYTIPSYVGIYLIYKYPDIPVENK